MNKKYTLVPYSWCDMLNARAHNQLPIGSHFYSKIICHLLRFKNNLSYHKHNCCKISSFGHRIFFVALDSWYICATTFFKNDACHANQLFSVQLLKRYIREINLCYISNKLMTSIMSMLAAWESLKWYKLT